MRLISTGVRTLTQTSEMDTSALGPHWDILWLENCGEQVEEQGRHFDFPDTTRVPTEAYAGWAKPFLRSGGIAEGNRRVQDAILPVCSFGYGVTRDSAPIVHSLLAKCADEAFDAALQHHCVLGGLRCIVVFPEVMHHYEPPKDAGYKSVIHVADGEKDAADEIDFEGKKG